MLLWCCSHRAHAHHPVADSVLHPKVVRTVPTQQPMVALTFDDGPYPIYTPAILRLLDEYHAHATFFMIGTAIEQHPEIVREVVAQGHVVGNHTYTHPHDLRACSPEQVHQELHQCAESIATITGHQPSLFRAPCGRLNATIMHIATAQHYTVIGWTVCADHHEAPTPEQMAYRVLTRVHPGAIILLHDGRTNARWKDVKATALILAELHRQGYQCVTLPELLAQTQTK